jgi:hypothetical protein
MLMPHTVVVPPLNKVIQLSLDYWRKNPIKQWPAKLSAG